MPCIDHGKHGDAKGYATKSYKNKTVKYHRLVYAQHNNVTLESIKGTVVRHTCDNSRCINPKHLILGTVEDNIRDRQDRNRQAKGTTHACASFTDEQVLDIRKVHTKRCPVNGTKALASKYGVSERSIQSIISRQTWKHI